MQESPGLHQAYLAPSYPLIRDIFYPKVAEFLNELGLKFKINESKSIVTIQGMGNIYCRSMDNPDNIVGWEVGDAFLDELDTVPTLKATKVYEKVLARIRQPIPGGIRPNQMFVSTTPEGFKATYEMFVKNPLSGSELIQMSTYSNAHNLPEDYIDTLRSMYPSNLIEAYLNGKFVNLNAGSVYYAYQRDLLKLHTAATDHPSLVQKMSNTLHVGMDFNVNRMCATISLLERDPRTAEPHRLHVVNSLFGLRDTPDMVDSLLELYPDHNICVYPDASGRGTSAKSASLSDISILRDAGFQINARSKNPRIKDRVASVNAALEQGKLAVNQTKAKDVCDSLEQQVYNPKTGLPEKDGILDDRNDSLGYLVYYFFPVNKQLLTERTLD